MNFYCVFHFILFMCDFEGVDKPVVVVYDFRYVS